VEREPFGGQRQEVGAGEEDGVGGAAGGDLLGGEGRLLVEGPAGGVVGVGGALCAEAEAVGCVDGRACDWGVDEGGGGEGGEGCGAESGGLDCWHDGAVEEGSWGRNRDAEDGLSRGAGDVFDELGTL